MDELCPPLFPSRSRPNLYVILLTPPLKQWLSKGGPRTSSVAVTQELVRHVNSCPPPPDLRGSGVGSSNLFQHALQVAAHTTLASENHCSKTTCHYLFPSHPLTTAQIQAPATPHPAHPHPQLLPCPAHISLPSIVHTAAQVTFKTLKQVVSPPCLETTTGITLHEK